MATASFHVMSPTNNSRGVLWRFEQFKMVQYPYATPQEVQIPFTYFGEAKSSMSAPRRSKYPQRTRDPRARDSRLSDSAIGGTCRQEQTHERDWSQGLGHHPDLDTVGGWQERRRRNLRQQHNTMEEITSAQDGQSLHARLPQRKQAARMEEERFTLPCQVHAEYAYATKRPYTLQDFVAQPWIFDYDVPNIREDQPPLIPEDLIGMQHVWPPASTSPLRAYRNFESRVYVLLDHTLPPGPYDLVAGETRSVTSTDRWVLDQWCHQFSSRTVYQSDCHPGLDQEAASATAPDDGTDSAPAYDASGNSPPAYGSW